MLVPRRNLERPVLCQARNVARLCIERRASTARNLSVCRARSVMNYDDAVCLCNNTRACLDLRSHASAPGGFAASEKCVRMERPADGNLILQIKMHSETLILWYCFIGVLLNLKLCCII